VEPPVSVKTVLVEFKTHASAVECQAGMSCLRLSCCLNAFIFCVHYLWTGLCPLRRTCRQDYETLFHVVILSKHHHHHHHRHYHHHHYHHHHHHHHHIRHERFQSGRRESPPRDGGCIHGQRIKRYIHVYLYVCMDMFMHISIHTFMYLYV
jgi:hypothetical protein